MWRKTPRITRRRPKKAHLKKCGQNSVTKAWQIASLRGLMGISRRKATVGQKLSPVLEQVRPHDRLILRRTLSGGTIGREMMELWLKLIPEVEVIVSSGASNDFGLSNQPARSFRGMVLKLSEIADFMRVIAQGSGGVQRGGK